MRLTVDTQSGAIVLTAEKTALKKVMRAAGNEVAAQARSDIGRASGGGRKYWNSGGNKYKPFMRGRHEASVPGSAPRKQTGTLQKSVKAKPWKSGEGVTVRSGSFWSAALEFGADGPGPRDMEPRPFLNPALESKSESIAERIKAALIDDIKFERQKPIRK